MELRVFSSAYQWVFDMLQNTLNSISVKLPTLPRMLLRRQATGHQTKSNMSFSLVTFLPAGCREARCPQSCETLLRMPEYPHYITNIWRYVLCYICLQGAVKHSAHEAEDAVEEAGLPSIT
jgi:hypothetical protein